MFIAIYIILVLTLVGLLVGFFTLKQQSAQQDNWLRSDTRLQSANQQLEERLRHLENQGQTLQQNVLEKFSDSRMQQQQAFNDHRTKFDERQMEALKILQDTLQKGVQDTRFSVKESLNDYATELGKRIETLTATTDLKLKEINQQVEKRLTEGFEKTTETFSDVVKRLALIDAAQKKITELSSSVDSLQEILNDKRSRGAFGEVQLAALIRNVIPEQHFSLQYTLSNDKRPDCILFLPEPTGNVVIDAKFPLESFRQLIDSTTSDADREHYKKQFKIDVRKHIQDIAEKYIIPGETADGAMMFIPAEAVFSEIHAQHPDVVEDAQRAKVWLVSPTTMMAILTTARAVLKDAATRKQLHIIQKHLNMLSTDFERFQKRMDNLTSHIAQAHTDVEQVNISARKITQRFSQIEKVELDHSLLGPEETISSTD